MGRVACSEKFPIEGNFSAGRVGDPPLRGGGRRPPLAVCFRGAKAAEIFVMKISVTKQCRKSMPVLPSLSIHTFFDFGQTMVTELKMLSSEGIFLRKMQRRESS